MHRQQQQQPAQQQQGAPVEGNKSDTNLESMMRAVAQLDMDEQGHWDYHGHSSGLSFVRRMREELGELMGPDTKATPFVKSRPKSNVIDSPRSNAESPEDSDIFVPGAELPGRDIARQLCSNTLDDASSLLRVVHQPSFWSAFDRIYDTPTDHYTNDDNRFLPLLYSVLALGSLFGKDETSPLVRDGYESAIQQGFAYFRSARQLMDIADCRDMESVQAVVFMIIFMQSTAKMSQCYAYVGVALRSSLRMGLHRAYAGDFSPIEAEIRKRLFWVVRKMDIYVGALLGLPQTLSDEDIDQEYPTEVDDEYITKDGILPMPEGSVSKITAFNAHTRLVHIIQKIVRKVYPIKIPGKAGNTDKSYSVPFSTIREIEGDLEKWKNDLNPAFNPSDIPTKFTRIQQLLRLAYAHAQVMLYRPFLHFVATDKQSQPVDQRAYACAASFVNVSRNIIHITVQMKQKGLLNGAFWFIMYTAFFSVLSLVYFAAENPENLTTEAVMKDALEGKQVLSALATRSMAADRCTATLDVVFARLPDWMREGKQNPSRSRKRPHDVGPSHSLGSDPKFSRSHPDVSVVDGDPQAPNLQRRASTFPKHNDPAPKVESPTSFDMPWTPYGAPAFGQQPQSANGYQSNQFHNFNPTSSMSSNMSFPMPHTSNNPALPDLSAMMFPSENEPLVYPHQPLTTFENNQQNARQNNQFINTQHLNNGMGSTSPMSQMTPRGEDMEAQFFALPPYIEQQRQQAQHHQQQQSGMRMPPETMYSSASNLAGMNAVQMPNGNGNWQTQNTMPQQQPDVGGNINIQDLFGGTEWNPMIMDLGYRQQ